MGAAGDTTTGWSSIATKTGFTTAILALSGYRAGNVIHLLVADGTAVSAVGVKYVSFDMLTETFLTTTETVNAAAITGPSTQAYGVAIMVRQNGEVVCFYNGVQSKTSGTFYSRLYYKRRTALNTYTAAVQVDANVVGDSVNPCIVQGSADRVHFGFSTANSARFRTLTAANALGAVQSAASTGMHEGTNYARGGTTKVVFAVGSAAIQFAYFDSADVPTVALSATIGNSLFPFRIGSEGTDVTSVYVDTPTSDLVSVKSTNDGATWSAPASFFVGTVVTGRESVSRHNGEGNAVFTRGASVLLPYIVNDNGTWKYNENLIRYVAQADAWNPNDKSASITLSNSDKTVTQTETNVATGARSTKLIPSSVAGKFYAEFVIDNIVTVGNSNPFVGIKSSTADVTVYDTGSVFLQANGYVQVASSGMGTLHGNATDGTVVGFAWDTSAKKVWFRQGTGSWTNSGDPATNTGGVSIAALASADYGLWTNLFSNTDAVSLRTELADLQYQGPSGYSTWMGEVIPIPSIADAWNANDVGATTALSNSDKTATATGTNGAARSTQKRLNGQAGKYYAEFRVDALYNRFGLKSATSNLLTWNTETIYISDQGLVLLNSSTIANLQSVPNIGDVMSLAWDSGTKRFWARINNLFWNGNAAADPATGANGIDFSVAPTTDHALYFQSGVVGSAGTIRTEKDEFTQTTPAGFLSWMGETLEVLPVDGTGALASARATTTSSGISGSTSPSGGVPASIVIEGGDGGDLIFGAINYGAEKEGQAFVSVGTSVTKITAKLCKYGVPTDGLRCRISTANENYLPVTLLGTTTVSVDAVPLNTTGPVEFTFASPVTVSKGQLYHVAIDRIGALDDENLYATAMTYGRVYTPMYSYDRQGGGEVWETDSAANLVLTVWQMDGIVVPPLQAASSTLLGTQPPVVSGTATLTPVNSFVTSNFAISSSTGTGALTILQARYNIVKRSEEMNLTPWGVVAVTVTADAAMAPNSTMTAERISDGTTYNQHWLGQTLGSTAGADHTCSIYAKAETLSWFQIQVGTNVYANFNIATGVVGLTGSLVTATSIVDVGNGWYRCSLTAPLTEQATMYPMLLDDNVAPVGPNYTNYQGSNRSLLFWGAQVEFGSLTAYIPTQAAAVKIDQGGPALTGLGLTGWSGTGALDVSVARQSMGVATNTNNGFGYDVAASQLGQSFIAITGQLSTINLTMAVSGSPADGVYLQVYNETTPATARDQPSDTIAVRTTTVKSYTFTFNPPINLVAGNSYSFSVARTGAIDANNFYRLRCDNDVYAGGTLLRLVSGAWTTVPANDATGILAFPNNSSRLAGVGDVSSPPVSGTGTLTTGTTALVSFGNVRFIATGVMAPAPATMVSSGVAQYVATGALNFANTQLGNASATSSINFGKKIGQSFVADRADLTSIRLLIRAIGLPPDGLFAQIYNETTVPATTVGQASNVTTAVSAYTALDFTFNPPIKLTVGNSYSFVVDRVGPELDNDYFQLKSDPANVYAGGNILRYTTSWIATPGSDAVGYLQFANYSQLSGLGDVGYVPRTGTGVLSSGIAVMVSAGSTASGGDGALLPSMAA